MERSKFMTFLCEERKHSFESILGFEETFDSLFSFVNGGVGCTDNDNDKSSITSSLLLSGRFESAKSCLFSFLSFFVGVRNRSSTLRICNN